MKVNRHWLLGGAGLGILGALILSPYPWGVLSQPGFDEIAVLPAPAQRPVRAWLDDNGVTLPWPALPEAQQPQLAMGNAYRVVSALKLPLAAYRDPGLMLFDKRGKWKPPVRLDPDGEKMVEEAAGSKLDAGYRFGWWRYLWGWLFLLPLLAWTALQIREDRRRKDAAGIM